MKSKCFVLVAALFLTTNAYSSQYLDFFINFNCEEGKITGLSDEIRIGYTHGSINLENKDLQVQISNVFINLSVVGIKDFSNNTYILIGNINEQMMGDVATKCMMDSNNYSFSLVSMKIDLDPKYGDITLLEEVDQDSCKIIVPSYDPDLFEAPQLKKQCNVKKIFTIRDMSEEIKLIKNDVVLLD